MGPALRGGEAQKEGRKFGKDGAFAKGNGVGDVDGRINYSRRGGRTLGDQKKKN